MENVKKLLSVTDYSIETVALTVGYQKTYNMNSSTCRILSRNLN